MSKFLAVAKPSVWAKVLSKIPAVLAEAAKLQSPALDTTIASGTVAVLVAVFGNVHLTAAEVAGWLALTGTIAAAAEKVFGPTPAPTPVPTAK